MSPFHTAYIHTDIWKNNSYCSSAANKLRSLILTAPRLVISKRLGIEDSIIQRAKELVSAENTKFEDVVRSLEETRQKLEEEKAQAEALRLQAKL